MKYSTWRGASCAKNSITIRPMLVSSTASSESGESGEFREFGEFGEFGEWGGLGTLLGSAPGLTNGNAARPSSRITHILGLMTLNPYSRGDSCCIVPP